MFKKFLLGLLSLLTVSQFALATMPAGAQGFDPLNGNPLGGIEATNLGNGQGAGTAGSQLPILVGKIIRAVLGILGIIFLVLVVYAGFLWMTAQGDDKKVGTAKMIIKNTVIGFVIIFLAYAITGFIVSTVVKATGNGV